MNSNHLLDFHFRVFLIHKKEAEHGEESDEGEGNRGCKRQEVAEHLLGDWVEVAVVDLIATPVESPESFDVSFVHVLEFAVFLL